MKIDFSPMRNVAAGESNKVSNTAPAFSYPMKSIRTNMHTDKQDEITISREGSLQRDVSLAAKPVLSDVKEYESAASDRVNELRSLIAENKYYVPAQEVANAMMGYVNFD